MIAPRLEVDLDKVAHNAGVLVSRLGTRGIRVTGVTKATLGSPDVAAAMVRGGVAGLGDSRIENLGRLRAAGMAMPLTLIRSPMLSQVDAVVRHCDVSLNTEPIILAALSDAADDQKVIHEVVLMVELGDLREGLASTDVLEVAQLVGQLPGLTLAGIGTNLACQSGVVPDQSKMDELSALVEDVEAACGHRLSVVSGGNSASLSWALTTDDVGRVDDLRLGESILLGTEPLHREAITGLHTDAFALVAEVIEVKTKPAQPWGEIAQGAFGTPPPRLASGGFVRQAILALGHQDVDPAGLTPPAGVSLLGAASDHLVVDVGDLAVTPGDELTFQLDYSALVRAMTSPYVTTTVNGVPAGR